MIGRMFRWTGGIVSAVVLILVTTVTWLVATETGARWLLAQASPRLPDPLSIEEVSGTLLSVLEFRNVAWQDEAATVSAAELDVRLELMPLFKREVRINTLAIRNVNVTVRERASRETDPEPLDLDVPITLRLETASVESIRIATAGNELLIDTIALAGELSGAALKIRRFDLQSRLVDFGLSGNAQLTGSYPLDASAGWEFRLVNRPPLSGVLHIRGDASRYDIKHDLDAPYTVATQGTVAIADAGLSLDVNNRWGRILIEQGDAPAIELDEGMLRIVGFTDSLLFNGVTMVSSTDIPDTAVQAHGRYDGSRVDFDSLSVANEWGRLGADGGLQLSAEPSWSFDLTLSELNPALADPRLQGSLEIVGNTTGRLNEGEPDIELAIDRISGDLNGHPVTGKGLLAYAGDRLKFDKATVRVGDNRIDFDGSYGARSQVNAKAQLSDLGQFGLGIEGALSGNFNLESHLDVFSAAGNASGENLALGDYALDRLDLRFDLPAAGKGSASLQIESTEQGSLSTSFDGRFVDQQWLGTIRTLAVNREPVGEWILRDAAGFSLSRSGLELETACLGMEAVGGLACIAFSYNVSGSLEFEATLNALPLAALPRYLPEGASITGHINAEARGNLIDGRLNASTRLQVDGLNLLASFEGDEVSATFESASARADIVDNKLVGEFDVRLDNSLDHASGQIEIADLFDTQSTLDGRGSLALNDLALLSFFVPDLGNPAGEIFGRIEATGSLAVPGISGEIGLRDGSVDVRRAGVTVTEIGLLLRQSTAGEMSLQGSAKSGDGYLQVGGETSFGADTGIRSEVRLNGEDFSLVRLPDWRATASPAITVLFDERETRVSGELGIPAADIAVKTVPESSEKPSPDAVLHRGDVATTQPRRALFVDVTTRLGDNVKFSGFGLGTKLEGSVRITGDSKSPYRGFGRVVLHEGHYRAYGQDLAIESGELIFNGPLNNPALNVRATRTASDQTIAGIHLTGTPTQLESQVYSEPPLGDAEALSYLLTGRPLSGADSEQGDMLNQAAFALGLSTAGGVVSQIRNELGLESLGVQGGAENRQLVAGKRIGNRLFIEYAYGLVDNLGMLLLRYQLSRRLVVESRSGSVRNLDVVYSVKKP